MKGNLLGFGIALALLGLLAIFVGVICVIVGALSKSRATTKVGAYVLVGGAVGLLCSFTLCSTSL